MLRDGSITFKQQNDRYDGNDFINNTVRVLRVTIYLTSNGKEKQNYS